MHPWQMYCFNLLVGVALNVWFTTNVMCVKNDTHIYVARTSNDHGMWLLLAATVWNFAHLPLGLSDCNKMVLWPGCEGCARCNLHKKNVWSVRFVVKRWGCCCNLSVGVVLNAQFTGNRMCAKNNTHIYMWHEQPIIEWSWHVISIVAGCRSVKLCALAAQAFRSQQYETIHKINLRSYQNSFGVLQGCTTFCYCWLHYFFYMKYGRQWVRVIFIRYI